MIVRSQKRFSKNGIIGQAFGEKDVFSLNMGHSNRSNERQSPYRIFGPNVIMCCVVSSCSRGGVWFQSLFFSCGMFSNGMSRSRPAVDPVEWKLQKFLRHDARQKYGVNVRSDGLMPLERVLRALNAQFLARDTGTIFSDTIIGTIPYLAACGSRKRTTHQTAGYTTHKMMSVDN